jgi:hypothetical protein
MVKPTAEKDQQKDVNSAANSPKKGMPTSLNTLINTEKETGTDVPVGISLPDRAPA